MTTASCLWAIGYDDVDQVHQVRDHIVNLARR